MKYLLITFLLFNIVYANTKYKNEVLLECIDNVNCKSILKQYNFKNISNLTSKIILIKLDDKDALDISNILKQNTNIKYAHPNYIRTKKRR